MRPLKNYDAVIIGAGSVGVVLAYWLARKGLKVVVLDKQASPGRGENKAAIGGIRATHSDPAKIKVGKRSLEFIRRLQPEFGQEVDYVEGGYLFPVYDDTIATRLQGLLIKQKQLGLNIDWVSPERVSSLAPGIRQDGLLGGTYSPHDGHLSPLKLAGAFYRLALQEGVDFCFRTEVVGFEIVNRRVVAVKTNNESLSAEYVVNAAGAHAREVGLLLGTELPVFPDSHEAGVSEPVSPFLRPMIVDIQPNEESDNYYFYQNKEGALVFCITPRPKRMGTDIRSTSEFLPMVIKRMLRLYPRLSHLKVRRIWRGLYPMTPDESPIVGFDREVNGVFHAVGMCGQGLMLGPGLAEMIADFLVDQTLNSDKDVFDQLSPYRKFTGRELLK